MSRSFLIASDTPITIEKFHVNVWRLGRHNYVDLGCLFNLDSVSKKRNINLDIHLPFVIDTRQDLFEVINDSKVIQLLFNEKVETTAPDNLDPPQNTGFKLCNAEEFILTRLASLNFDPSLQKLSLKFRMPTGFQMKKIYSRVRLKIRRRSNLMIYEDYDATTNKLFFDLAVSDTRVFNFPNLGGKDIFLPEKVYIFLIMPSKFKLTLNVEEYFKWTRLLENNKDAWGRYFKGLRLKKANYIVYYWKVTGGGISTSGGGFNNMSLVKVKC